MTDNGKSQLPGALLSPAEWDRRAAILDLRVAEWMNDEDADDDTSFLAEAALLYGLNRRQSELCFEKISRPVDAPSFGAAARMTLTLIALDAASDLWDSQGVSVANQVWFGPECWCWNQPETNPRCPRHRAR